ncbi:unnamed protein product [Sphagnum jensenii]|uniref:Uncharacterized protein n=1 Tax=Sphagnum jensenii TaxID=128206 RepID=A0ABP1AIH5_9BRYO
MFSMDKNMEESRKVSDEWLESNLWEPPKEMEEEEGELEEEDLDEYEGVVQALSNLESRTRVRAFQPRALDIKVRSLNPRHRFAENRASDAGSFDLSASSSSWESTHGSLARWSKFAADDDIADSLQLDVGTSESVHGQHGKVILSGKSIQNDHLLHSCRSGRAYGPEHESGFKMISSTEEALRQRIEDLEKKVNMLISEDCFHRINVPRGCFAIVLPGPSYAHQFTEDVTESLQMRMESIWPLCYLSPVVAKLAGVASALFRWLPLPSPVYTCNFTPALDCQTPRYVTKRLGI